jgi:hypothetical protein
VLPTNGLAMAKTLRELHAFHNAPALGTFPRGRLGTTATPPKQHFETPMTHKAPERPPCDPAAAALIAWKAMNTRRLHRASALHAATHLTPLPQS